MDLFYMLIIEPVYGIFSLYYITGRDVWKWTVICRIFGNPWKDCRSFIDEKLWALCHQNLSKWDYYIVLLSPLLPFINSKIHHLEWPFWIKFCFVPVCLELWSLAFEAWLLLNLQWMLSANFKPKRNAVASRGFLATAWLSCIISFS